MTAVGIGLGVVGLGVMAYGGVVLYRVRAGMVSTRNRERIGPLGRRITYTGFGIALLGAVVLLGVAADIVS